MSESEFRGPPGPAPSDPLPLQGLLRLLNPITYFCIETPWLWKGAPRWVRWWRDFYMDWFLSHTLDVRMERAFAQGVGLFTAQFPAGTEAAAVVAWFEQQILSSQPTRISPLDTVMCYVYHSPTEVGAPIGDIIGMWQGEASRWWAEGAEVVAALVPADHFGLHVLISCVSDLVAAASQPAPRG